MSSLERLQSSWLMPLSALGVVLAFVLALNWPTAASIFWAWWQNNTYSHGVLVIPICVVLLGLRSHFLRTLRPRPSALGLAVFATLATGLIFFERIGVQVVQQLCLIAMIPAMVWALLGWPLVRANAFPFFFLAFAVPMGDGLVAPMQDLTARLSADLLRLSMVPVHLEHRTIDIPGGSFEVAEACSGVRYLIATLALSFFYAFLSLRSTCRRVLFCGLCVVIAVLANVLRVYGIVLTAYLTEMRVAVDVDHLIQGWIFFAVIVVLMLALGRLMREPVGVGLAPRKLVGDAIALDDHKGTHALMGGALILVISLTTWAGAVLETTDSTISRDIRLTTPVAPHPWRDSDETRLDWAPDFVGADAYLMKQYVLESAQVDVYVSYYQRQRQGSELINWQNRVYRRDRWRQVAQGTETLQLDDGMNLPVRNLQLRSVDQSRMIWFWYDISGHETRWPIWAKVLEAWFQLSNASTGSALIAISARYEMSPDESRETLRQFLGAFYGNMRTCLLPGDRWDASCNSSIQ